MYKDLTPRALSEDVCDLNTQGCSHFSPRKQYSLELEHLTADVRCLGPDSSRPDYLVLYAHLS